MDFWLKLKMKIKCALGNRDFEFLEGKKAEKLVVFISDIGICGIYSSLTLGTAKFELLD